MDTLIENLRAALGRERVLSAAHELLVYECDGLPQYKETPRAVLFPESTEEVSEVVRLLAGRGVSFVARGAGTGLSGGALALGSGVVIELARMRRLLKLDLDNRLAVVQTGMVNAHLSRAVAPHGLHYAPDPSSQVACTVGGNIAENAGGIHCLKYGVTVDHILGARVVLSDGEVVDLGGAGCEAPGYDLLGVFVGSEGTFGIATEATVRLTPLPQAVRTLLADFTDINGASRAVSAIIAAGIIPAALEMVDGATIRAVEASVFAAGLPLDAEAALLVELDGLEAGLDEETARVEAICREQGARSCRRAADEGERKRLWAARKGAFGAMGRLAPDVMIQDAVVPRSRLPEVLAETYRVGAKHRLRLANVFHAGDGNLHPFISFDSRDHDEERRVKEAGREIMEACVRAGGTITGEHGVGLDKSAYLPLIFSDITLQTMLRVRAAFDPSGLCNPGKIIPVLRGCGEGRAVVSSKESVRAREGGRRELDAAVGTVTEGVPTFQGFPHPSPPLFCAPFDPVKAMASLIEIVGAQHVSERWPVSVAVEPGTKEEACEVLRLASSEGWAVVPAGAGTWPDAGNTLTRAEVFIKTTRLTSVIEHEPADLVATAQSGLSLSGFNAALAETGQWLPLDPPDAGRSTLGGVVASGLAGAQSAVCGPVRAHVLGMEVALADGSLIRVGGRVVKNVAGYDLCKLFVGSHGTLGLILDITFRLRPRPHDEATVVGLAGKYQTLLEAGRALIGAGLMPAAAELLSPRAASEVIPAAGRNLHALLIRFAGSGGAVAWQVERALRMFKEKSVTVDSLKEENDASVWSRLQALCTGTSPGIALRASVPPSRLDAMIETLENSLLARENMTWHAGLADGRLRVLCGGEGDDVSIQSASLKKLRAAAREWGGSLVVERAADEIKHAVGVLDIPAEQLSIMRRVKSQLDPGRVFSPGRLWGDEG